MFGRSNPRTTTAGVAHAEPLDDLVAHRRRRRRRQRQHRGWPSVDDLAEAQVLGPEVVSHSLTQCASSTTNSDGSRRGSARGSPGWRTAPARGRGTRRRPPRAGAAASRGVPQGRVHQRRGAGARSAIERAGPDGARSAARRRRSARRAASPRPGRWPTCPRPSAAPRARRGPPEHRSIAARWPGRSVGKPNASRAVRSIRSRRPSSAVAPGARRAKRRRRPTRQRAAGPVGSGCSRRDATQPWPGRRAAPRRHRRAGMSGLARPGPAGRGCGSSGTDRELTPPTPQPCERPAWTHGPGHDPEPSPPPDADAVVVSTRHPRRPPGGRRRAGARPARAAPGGPSSPSSWPPGAGRGRGRCARQVDDQARCWPTPSAAASACIGATTPPAAGAHGGVAWGEGPWFVAEADESDRSLLRLAPEARHPDQRGPRPPHDLRQPGRGAGRVPRVPRPPARRGCRR